MRVNTFLVARYIVFGLFTTCNAIICSVAAWNLGLVQAAKPQQVDVYLIFLGAFSLVSIFTLIFVELLRSRPLTTRVWFECAWVTLFWVMQLAGGAALIAIDSNMSCPPNTTASIIHALCTSERVLLAFTWICAVILLIYLLVLVFLAASRGHFDVWDSDIQSLRLSTARQTYAAVQPTIVQTKQSVDMDHTHRPPRIQTTQHHGGLSSKYDIEPFRPVFAAPQQMDISHSNLPEAIPLPLLADPTIPQSKLIPVPSQCAGNAVPASLGLYDMPRERVPSSSYPGPSPQTHVPRKQSVSSPAPSPLGNWPRQDIMKQPVEPKKSRPPPSAYEFPGSHVGGLDVPNANPQRSRRPSGPRLRVPSGESSHQPPDFYPSVSASHIASEVVR